MGGRNSNKRNPSTERTNLALTQSSDEIFFGHGRLRLIQRRHLGGRRGPLSRPFPLVFTELLARQYPLGFGPEDFEAKSKHPPALGPGPPGAPLVYVDLV